MLPEHLIDRAARLLLIGHEWPEIAFDLGIHPGTAYANQKRIRERAYLMQNLRWLAQHQKPIPRLVP